MLIYLVTCLCLWACVAGRVCPSADIRNSVAEVERLRGCRVVEGYVRIVLMERGQEEEFFSHSLPELREVTQYVMLYRVAGLHSVGQLFPNLTVIRGDVLFEDYALVVYEMFHLLEVGLTALSTILRGAVRIEKNPSE